MARLKASERSGPGLLLVLVALVVAGLVGAKYLGLSPGGTPSKKRPPAGTAENLKEPGSQEQLARILIYHSHTSENYQPGESHSRGKPGEIVSVGEELSRALEEKGIKTIHNKTIHDYPRYDEAFINAGATLNDVLRANQGIEMVLDVHRDGLPPGKPDGYTTADIGGQTAAKILIVVGDVANPYAAENIAFAEQVRETMNALYPGLARGVKVQHGNYNGNIHPNSVQVFVGDYRDNSLDEALISARLLADMLAQIVNEPAP